MGLPRLVIGVLAYDDHLHLMEGAQVKGIEDERPWRVASPLTVFTADGFGELCEVRLLELCTEAFFPTGFYLDIHIGR